MLHRLTLKVNKFQVTPPKRSSTVVKNIFFGGGASSPPMSNRVNHSHVTGGGGRLSPVPPPSCILQTCILRLVEEVITSKLDEQKYRNGYYTR